jgi:hypothetical protein
MSISVVINHDLWGLVACHGYGDAGIRVSLPIRELCRNIVSPFESALCRLILNVLNPYSAGGETRPLNCPRKFDFITIQCARLILT